MEQQLAAGLGERQIAEFIEDDEVDTGEAIGEAAMAAELAGCPNGTATTCDFPWLGGLDLEAM